MKWRQSSLALFILGIIMTSSSVFGSVRFIHDGWRLARRPDITADGTAVSQVGFDDSTWIPAVVPGTVLTSYEQAGLIEDPYYRDNLKTLPQDDYNVDYWYRTEFDVPADDSGRRIWLNFDGVHWKAHIYLNGSKLADLDGAFIRGRYEVTDRVNIGGSNALAVRLEWCDTKPVDAPTFIASAGWDWMPPIPGRNLGLYEDVYLSTSGDVTLADPQVVTDLPLPDTSSADVTVTAEVANHAETAVSGTLTGTIEPLGITFSRPVTLNAGRRETVTFDPADFPQLHLQNPQLWWPNGYGDQTLHTLTLNFRNGSAVSDTRKTRFGIREYSYDMDGHELYLSVNGCRVLCKGGNWGMPEAMLKWTGKDFDTALRLHREMNFTMIRTWHGNSDFKAFYDACDQYGLMVFEDFWMDGYYGPDNPDMFMAAARDKIRRLRNHPCVAVWCAKNEMRPAGPVADRLAAALDELDGTRHSFEASNRDGIHGGDSYTVMDPAWYFGAASGFTTEIGSPCVPSVESMRRMMDEEDLWPIGDIWAWHDWDQDIGNKRPDRYEKEVNNRYGIATGIEDFCRKAQLVNLETYKAVFEAWNQKLWNDCGGVLLWMSQSAWPSTVWQTYDYYFEGTGAYYGAKKACEPVHVQWNCYDGSVRAINNTRRPLNGVSVEAQVYNLDGRLRHSHLLPQIDLPPDSSVHCFNFMTPVGANLALNRQAVASSEKEEVLDRHPAASAVDADVRTRWASDYSDPQWIYVDLGTVCSIDTVVLQWEVAYGRSYEIQVSRDAREWTPVYSTTGGDGGTDRITFDPVDARYVRMYGHNRGTYYGYSLHEFIVYRTGTAPTPTQGLSDVHFVKLRLKDTDGKVLSDNFYWHGTTHLDYTALSTLQTVNLDGSARRQQRDDKIVLSTKIKNRSDRVAFAVRLKLLKAASGDRVLPAFYGDNYFSLLPGESKTVSIEFETDRLKGEPPRLMVEGWNIKPEEVPIL